jgi:outer membrane murein-binding lipoprotein Lpp
MDLMTMSNTVLKLLDSKPLVRYRNLVLIAAAAAVCILAGSVYAKYVPQMEKISSIDSRVCTLETDRAVSAEQLRNISESLARIESSQNDIRRDVSDLKTSLIRK